MKNHIISQIDAQTKKQTLVGKGQEQMLEIMLWKCSDFNKELNLFKRKDISLKKQLELKSYTSRTQDYKSGYGCF